MHFCMSMRLDTNFRGILFCAEGDMGDDCAVAVFSNFSHDSTGLCIWQKVMSSKQTVWEHMTNAGCD